MFKKIIKYLFLMLIIFNIKQVNSDYIICDSGDINFEGKTLDEICIGGYKSFNISEIESFTGSYTNFESGYLGTDFNNIINNKIEGSFPFGYFDKNKNTYVSKKNPEYKFEIGYIGNNFSYKNVGIQNDVVIGFFDENKNTVLKNTKPLNFSPVGFFGTHKYKKSKSSGGNIVYKKEYSYKEFLIETFLLNIDPKHLRKYSKKELEEFCEKIIKLICDGNKNLDKTINYDSKNIIRDYITKSDFKINLNILIENIDNINLYLNDKFGRDIKIYIIDYYKNY